jgi:hypothetical protein
MNIHLKTKLAKTDIQRALAILELCPGLELDEQLKLSTLEGETDLFEVVSLLLSANEDDEGTIDALDAQVDARAIRIERAKARIETRKKAIISLMDCAQERTLRLPEIRTMFPKPKVNDPDQLPDDFVTIETVRKPNKEAIEAAVENGCTIPGVVMTNGGASLTVRRK